MLKGAKLGQMGPLVLPLYPMNDKFWQANMSLSERLSLLIIEMGVGSGSWAKTLIISTQIL